MSADQVSASERARLTARAAVANATVVTMESLRPNGAGIPNICNHFNVSWLSLEQFMEAEGWTF